MFTGIVQAVGRVSAREQHGGDLRLVFRCPAPVLAGAAVGDSIAVNGVCLTAISVAETSFSADLSAETLARTTLGDLRPRTQVNLEPALRVGQSLSGHFVSGHIDGVARVLALRDDARALRLEIELPAGLAAFVVEKGSIAVDGVSLTVNEVGAGRFGVAIIPHTRERTIVGGYRVGTGVNLEADLIARYLRGMLPGAADAV